MKIKLSYRNVSQYLLDAGICQGRDLESMMTALKPSKSKNFNLIISLPRSCKLVVKQERNDENRDTTNRICNEWRLHNFLRSCPDLSYTSWLAPELLHFDESNSILIYKCPTDYIDLESYYRNQKAFPTAIAELVGTTLATLHRETLNSRDCYNFMTEAVEGQFRYQLPYPGHLLDRIEPETLSDFPSPGYKFLSFYQRYESLRAAVAELVFHHQRCCLTHNSPQLNNIWIATEWERLLSKTKHSDESIIRLIDWEYCIWGDPAFDLGIAIAGYLLLWLNSLIVHPAIELEKSLQLATIPLEVIQPSTVALVRAYISSFPKILEDRPDFLNRVIQFAGLALIYQLLAMIQYQKDFNNRGICMLQIAKGLLCRPETSFISVFGVTELALIELIPYSIK